MKLFKLAITTAAVFGLSQAAQAQDNDFYINLGLDSYDFDALGIGAKLGQNFHENFGLEAQGSVGIVDYNENIGGIEFDTNVDYSLAAFAVGRVEASDNFTVFVRGGYHYTEVTANAENSSLDLTIDADGFAIGGGAQLMANANNGIRAEYTYYDADDGGNLDVFSVSYVRKF